MSEYPFNLQGDQGNWHGNGLTASQIQEGLVQVSQEFTLTQGVVIAAIEHHGNGDFRLGFVSNEHFIYGEDNTMESSVGGGAAGAAAGAAIGSIIPVVGTIAGALIGGGAGIFAGSAASDYTESQPIVWTPVDYNGKLSTFGLAQVNENDENALPPGRYHIEVTSRDRWTCRFIQPDLGQSLAPLVDEAESLDQEGEVEAGLYVLGPYESGSRPMLANIRHRGRGWFYAVAYSADGTHQCTLFEEEGQFRVEEYQTEIKPGKEYFFYIVADGGWQIAFTEGY